MFWCLFDLRNARSSQQRAAVHQQLLNSLEAAALKDYSPLLLSAPIFSGPSLADAGFAGSRDSRNRQPQSSPPITLGDVPSHFAAPTLLKHSPNNETGQSDYMRECKGVFICRHTAFICECSTALQNTLTCSERIERFLCNSFL